MQGKSTTGQHEAQYGLFWGRKQRWGKGGFRVVLGGRKVRKLEGRWDNMAVTQELVAGEDACLAAPGFWSVQPVLSSP